MRTALLSIPAGADKYPLTVYGHGNTIGLQYGEIVSLFDTLQASTAILAPTFPAETNVCSNADGCSRLLVPAIL